MKIPNNQLILELMAARSGTTMLAREIKDVLRDTYSRGMSSKSVSKALTVMDEDYDMVNRRRTNQREKALYNCRWVYLYGFFDPTTGEVA